MPGVLTATQMFYLTVAAGAATAVYTTDQARKAQHSAQDKAQRQAEARRRQLQQQELKAGEYFADINRKQMELQAQGSNIKLLADLFDQAEKTRQPEVVTLPPAKEYSAVDNFNQAVHDLITRN